MAAVDEAMIKVKGYGGHGSEPEKTADPIMAGASIVMALQTIKSRNVPALDPAVVTVAAFHGGSASNIIPSSAEIVVGIRTFSPVIRDQIEERIKRVAAYQAESFGLTAEVDYLRSYDATINHTAETDFARNLALKSFGATNVIELERPFMGSEDFAYMLVERPGTYFFWVGARERMTSSSTIHLMISMMI